jgi:hypothetical protein
MNQKVLITIAEASEAVEIVAPVDVLRRTDGVRKKLDFKNFNYENYFQDGSEDCEHTWK